MGQWHKTGCVLCAQNCGLEARVEDNRMVKIRPDKDNPCSRGYACRKGLNVIYHQYPADRLYEPLKRVANGSSRFHGTGPSVISPKSCRIFWPNMDPAVWPIWAAVPRGATWRPPSGWV